MLVLRGFCMKVDPKKEVNGHKSSSLDCNAVVLGSFNISKSDNWFYKAMYISRLMSEL